MPHACTARSSCLRRGTMGCARLLLLLPLLLLGSAVGVQLGAENGPSSAPLPLRRAKRCSCSSLMDEECVYFCHLDIIWINTPQKTVPYGLGGPSRARRSLKDTVSGKLAESNNRCRCANQKDMKCLNFCQTGKELWAQSTIQKGWDHLNKGESCKGLKCLHRELLNSRKMRRLEAIGNSIKASFRIAKLKTRLHEVKQLKHNRAHRRQNSWESQKTS